MRSAGIIGLVASLVVVGCDDEFNYNTSHGGAVEGEGIDAVQSVMDGNCAGCHSGASSSAGLDLTTDFCGAVLDGRMVIPGDSAGSVLYQRISGVGSSMPPSGLMEQANIDIVRDWIDAGADCTSIGGTGGGGTDTGDAPASGEDLYAANCAGCHGADGGGGNGPAMGYIVPGMDAEDVAEVIMMGEDSMPPIAVTAEEANAIAEYVIATWGQ